MQMAKLAFIQEVKRVLLQVRKRLRLRKPKEVEFSDLKVIRRQDLQKAVQTQLKPHYHPFVAHKLANF